MCFFKNSKLGCTCDIQSVWCSWLVILNTLSMQVSPNIWGMFEEYSFFFFFLRHKGHQKYNIPCNILNAASWEQISSLFFFFELHLYFETYWCLFLSYLYFLRVSILEPDRKEICAPQFIGWCWLCNYKCFRTAFCFHSDSSLFRKMSHPLHGC